MTEELIAKAADIYVKNIREHGGESNMGPTGLGNWLGVSPEEAREIRKVLLKRKIIKYIGHKANHYEEDEISLGYDGKRKSARVTPYWGVGENALSE
jgi:hypothetical protein